MKTIENQKRHNRGSRILEEKEIEFGGELARMKRLMEEKEKIIEELKEELMFQVGSL